MKLQDAMIARDEATPRSIVAEIAYADTKLLRTLRGRSGRVDLFRLTEHSSLPPGATSVTVYRFEPPRPTAADAGSPTV